MRLVGAGRLILLYFTIDGAIWGGPYADSIVIYNRWRDFCPSVRRLAGVGRDILLYFTTDGAIDARFYCILQYMARWAAARRQFVLYFTIFSGVEGGAGDPAPDCIVFYDI